MRNEVENTLVCQQEACVLCNVGSYLDGVEIGLRLDSVCSHGFDLPRLFSDDMRHSFLQALVHRERRTVCGGMKSLQDHSAMSLFEVEVTSTLEDDVTGKKCMCARR
jgi:hypothetical protein